MQEKVQVQLLRQPAEEGQPVRWQAKVGDALFPVAGCEMGVADDGTAVVVLTISASTVTVGDAGGDTPAPVLRPAVPGNQPKSYWGNPNIPDPREKIGLVDSPPPTAQQFLTAAPRGVLQ